jgi:hypothetical protein
MAANKTRSALRTEIRNRGDFQTPYFTDSELNSYINDSIASLWDLIISTDPTRYVEQADISVVSGTRAYNLPADYYLLQGVELTDSSAPSGYRTMPHFNWHERNDGILSNVKWDARYEVRGSKIRFHPTPNWTETVQIHYIPTATSLDSDGATFDSINTWTEWVVLDVCIKCANKEEVSPVAWESRKSQVESRILMAGPQDRGNPVTVTNIYRSRWRNKLTPWEYT